MGGGEVEHLPNGHAGAVGCGHLDGIVGGETPVERNELVFEGVVDGIYEMWQKRFGCSIRALGAGLADDGDC